MGISKLIPRKKEKEKSLPSKVIALLRGREIRKKVKKKETEISRLIPEMK
jgi:hypothetical protein